MVSIKQGILCIAVLLSQVGLSQTSDNLVPYRQDFKTISAQNTVSITSYEKKGSHYVYTGGAGDIDVFRLNEDGKLIPVSNHELYKKKGPARGLVADNIGGTDFLFVGNKHGDAVEVFKILNDGALKQVFMVKDTESTHLETVITLQVVHMKQSSYLFVGGLELKTPGLSCFKIHPDGKLTHVQSMKDDDTIFTDGIIGMFVHKINGKTFLYTGGFQDNGVSSFRVYENGTFKNINNIADNTTNRYLTGAYPVTGVKLGSRYFVIVGHRHHKYYKRGNFIKNPDFVYHGDGVSVFEINRRGALVPHFVLKDDESSKLQGQTRIEVISNTGNEAILAVGTRDDASIQLCKLDQNGILTPINYLETGFSIYYGLRSHKINEDHFLIAGSNRFDLGKVASYKIAPKIDRSNKVLKHMVNLKYKSEITEAQLKEAVNAFINLKTEIPEIASIDWGVNSSTEGHSKGFTHCFTLTFHDEHALEIYLFHKAHLDLVNQVGPLLDDVLVMDYWTTFD